MKKFLILPLLTFVLTLAAAPLAAEPLDVGDDAPDVTTVDQNGDTVDLGEELAKGIALVYFYPKADTPGCTKQACNLRDEFEAVTDAGIRVFGVSADTSEDQLAFAEKYEIPFTLLADSEGEVISAFGVPTLNAKGFPARQSFLVKDGTIIWRDLKAAPTRQARDAIDAAKEHG